MLKEKQPASSGRDLLPADDRQPLGPIAFDRRRSRRAPEESGMMAAFFSDEAGVTMAWVELVDSSRHGVCLNCPLKITPGTRFNLYHNGAALPGDRGAVARCAERDGRFVLGLRFDVRAAA
jgi:hypothetical protein